MVKLKDAKCPNCGANIEVNDELEKTICQYCGSTVIIEEAIEKYKVELSGKVEVEGIKGRKDKLIQAKKHMSLAEYDLAKRILLEIIADDKFDTEAYIELVKVDIELIEKMNFDKNVSRYKNARGWRLVDEIYDYYERIKKIDDDNIVDKQLADYKEKLDYYCNVKAEEINAEKSMDGLVKKLNEYLEQVRRISPDCASVWVNEIVGKRFSVVSYFTKYQAVDGNGIDYSDKYRLNKFTKITIDGILEGEFYKTTAIYSTNPRTVNLIPINTKTLTEEQIQEKMQEIETLTPQYIAESTNVRNKQINKENGKIDRENAYTNVRNTLKYVWIGFLCLWILGFVIGTISTISKNGLGAGIAMIVFLDSWLVGIPVKWIIATKQDIDVDNKIKESKKRLKKDNI